MRNTLNLHTGFILLFAFPICFLVLNILTLMPVEAVPCHTIESGESVPSGYGAPYNVISAQEEMLIEVFCNSSSTIVKIGYNTNDLVYIWPTAYHFKNNQRFTKTLTCTGGMTGGWCRNRAQVTLTPGSGSQLDYVNAYICVWDGSNFRCGCRDEQCTPSFWQIQGF